MVDVRVVMAVQFVPERFAKKAVAVTLADAPRASRALCAGEVEAGAGEF